MPALRSGVLSLLLVALALPAGVLLAGADEYQDRLARYQAWLGGLSVLHLACVACWVLASERDRRHGEG